MNSVTSPNNYAPQQLYSALGTRLAPKTFRRGMHVIAWGGIFLHGVHEADFVFLLQHISAPDSSAQQFHKKTHGQRVF